MGAHPVLSLLLILTLVQNGKSYNPFPVYSDEFLDILPEQPKLEQLAESDDPLEFHEGPIYFPDENGGFILFTTQPVGNYADPKANPLNSIRRYDIDSGNVTTFRSSTNANMPNGQFRDPQGRLLTCEQGFKHGSPGRITRTDVESGEIEILINGTFGMELNSPNDIVVKSDGTVWFTDPSYGYLQSFRPEPQVGDFVYRFDADARGPQVTIVADFFSKPNGLAFSPDEHFLYLTDSGAIQGPGSWHPNLPHHIIRYDVIDGKHLRNRQLFAVVENNVTGSENPGIPDGIKLDQCGNVFVGAGDGVQVFNEDGDLVGKILTPTFVSNLEFGGQQGNDLFLMANSALYKVTLNAFGAGFPRIQDCKNKPHVFAALDNSNLMNGGVSLILLFTLMFMYLTKEKRNDDERKAEKKSE
ncbi:gluconolactonase-like [Ptychodera flava]|uniref:gluconolactonase-like n=1 Tax=Ptychodera flava TaxID=63121 RepID=UPI00396A2374